MAYSLTVNRVMELCAFEDSDRRPTLAEPSADARSVGKAFFQQMEEMSNRHLNSIFDKISARAAHAGLEIIGRERKPTDLEIVVLRGKGSQNQFERLFAWTGDLTGAEPPRDPIIGLFRSRGFEMQLGSQLWDLRVRPSVTACVLERDDWLSKLWWTFEGVPVGSDEAPSEREVIDFVRATTDLAEGAMPDLREAFSKSLGAVTGRTASLDRMIPAQLRVSLADNTDTGFSQLVDAMEISALPFTEAAAADDRTEMKSGADEVIRFVGDATKAQADPSAIKLSTCKGRLAAVHNEAVPEGGIAQDGIQKFVISGLASSIDMITHDAPGDREWTRQNTLPDLIRSISAARPMSARLADAGARVLDRRIAASAATNG